MQPGNECFDRLSFRMECRIDDKVRFDPDCLVATENRSQPSFRQVPRGTRSRVASRVGWVELE
jgi:hypothetical protein